jgi:NACalpha-BTF3-like transcription factor
MDYIQTLNTELIQSIQNHLESSGEPNKIQVKIDNSPDEIRKYITEYYPSSKSWTIFRSEYINKNTSVFDVINTTGHNLPLIGMAWFGENTIVYNIPNRKEFIIIPNARFSKNVEYPTRYTHDITEDEYIPHFTPAPMKQLESRAIRSISHTPINVSELTRPVYIRMLNDNELKKIGYNNAHKSNTFVPNETLAERNRRLSIDNNIEMVMEETGATREEVIRALDIHNGDVVNAILDLGH